MPPALLARQCVPLFLQALGETGLRLHGRSFGDRQGRGIRNVAPVVTGASQDGRPRSGSATPSSAYSRRTRWPFRSTQIENPGYFDVPVLDDQFHFLEQHRRVALQISLDVSGLVAMAPQTPHKHAEAVEIPGLFAVAVVVHNQMFFFLSSSSMRSERKIADDALALGVLRHFIGDGHGDQAREHPAGLSGRSADQAPAIDVRGASFWGGDWSAAAAASSRSVLESSSQSAGSAGGFGMGGGGTFGFLASFGGSLASWAAAGSTVCAAHRSAAAGTIAARRISRFP